MGWKYYDYICPECGCEFEEMVNSKDDEVLCPRLVQLDNHFGPEETCGAVCEIRLTSNLGWTNDPQAKKDMLMKRAKEHTAKEKRVGNILSERDLTGK